MPTKQTKSKGKPKAQSVPKKAAKPAIKRTYSLSFKAHGLLVSEAKRRNKKKPNLSGTLDSMILERFTKTK